MFAFKQAARQVEQTLRNLSGALSEASGPRSMNSCVNSWQKICISCVHWLCSVSLCRSQEGLKSLIELFNETSERSVVNLKANNRDGNYQCMMEHLLCARVKPILFGILFDPVGLGFSQSRFRLQGRKT